jgi:hypothetical protein
LVCWCRLQGVEPECQTGNLSGSGIPVNRFVGGRFLDCRDGFLENFFSGFAVPGVYSSEKILGEVLDPGSPYLVVESSFKALFVPFDGRFVCRQLYSSQFGIINNK